MEKTENVIIPIAKIIKKHGLEKLSSSNQAKIFDVMKEVYNLGVRKCADTATITQLVTRDEMETIYTPIVNRDSILKNLLV